MPGAEYIAPIMTNNVAVVSFVFQVFGVHLKMQVITQNKLKESLITALLGMMILRSNLWAPLKVVFFRDSGVSSVLEYPKHSLRSRGRLSSCMLYTLRFSVLASCFTLPPASMQSSVRWLFASLTLRASLSGVVFASRRLLALTKKSEFLEMPL